MATGLTRARVQHLRHVMADAKAEQARISRVVTDLVDVKGYPLAELALLFFQPSDDAPRIPILCSNQVDPPLRVGQEDA